MEELAPSLNGSNPSLQSSLAAHVLFAPFLLLSSLEAAVLLGTSLGVLRLSYRKLGTHPAAFSLLLLCGACGAAHAAVQLVLVAIWAPLFAGGTASLRRLPCAAAFFVGAAASQGVSWTIVLLSLQRFLATKTPLAEKPGIWIVAVAVLSFLPALSTVPKIGPGKGLLEPLELCTMEAIDVPVLLVVKVGLAGLSAGCLRLVTAANAACRRLLSSFAFERRQIPLEARSNLRYTIRLNATLFRSLAFEFGWSLLVIVPNLVALIHFHPKLDPVHSALLLYYSAIVFEVPGFIFFFGAYLVQSRLEDRRLARVGAAPLPEHFVTLRDQWETHTFPRPKTVDH